MSLPISIPSNNAAAIAIILPKSIIIIFENVIFWPELWVASMNIEAKTTGNITKPSTMEESIIVPGILFLSVYFSLIIVEQIGIIFAGEEVENIAAIISASKKPSLYPREGIIFTISKINMDIIRVSKYVGIENIFAVKLPDFFKSLTLIVNPAQKNINIRAVIL